MKTWLTILGVSAIMLVAVFIPYFNGWKPPQTITIATGQDVAMGASEPRSPLWPKVRAEHLAKNPECIACGFESPHNQVHHTDVPFHVDPSRELDPENLETFCGSEHWNCHFRIAHLGNWKCWNDKAREDAAYFRKRLESRKCE